MLRGMRTLEDPVEDRVEDQSRRSTDSSRRLDRLVMAKAGVRWNLAMKPLLQAASLEVAYPFRDFS
jgi:hypothetical protein